MPQFVEVATPTCAVTIGGTAQNNARTCSPQDFTAWQIGTRLNWRPVSGLTFSGDVVYTHLNTENGVVVSQANPAITRAADDSDGIWAGRIRIQRDF